MGKRRAEDLWVLGKDVVLDDGKGEAVTVYVRKMTPVDNQAALRRANAARARIRAVHREQDSDAYWDLHAEVDDMETKDELVAYLLMRPEMRVDARVEAELAAEDEWSTDGYLDGLKDAWTDGLGERHLVEPDEESERVWAELQRFAAEATDRAADEVAQLRADLEAQSEEDLREQAFRQVVTFAAENEWLVEFRACQLFYGARLPEDHNARYFRDRKQFDNLSTTARTRLRDAYDEMEVDPAEGKESEGTPSSSTSSESQPDSATGVSSGLVAVGR